MHKATFFPLGPADTCCQDLGVGKTTFLPFVLWLGAEDGDGLRIAPARDRRDDLDRTERDWSTS